MLDNDDLNLLRRYVRKYYFDYPDVVRRADLFRRVAGEMNRLNQAIRTIWYKDVLCVRGVGERPSDAEWQKLDDLVAQRRRIREAIAAGCDSPDEARLKERTILLSQE